MWRRIVLLLISLAIALMAAEATVRVAFQERVNPEVLRRQAAAGSIATLVQPVADPELLYELRPGLLTEWRGVLVATSPEGSRRISLLGKPAGEGALRVAVIGDSTSFGWGVPCEASYVESFGAQLSESLRAPVDVRNFSVPGYNIHQKLATFRRCVASWRPDLLVLHYDHNDVEPCNVVGPDFMPPDYGDNPLRSSLLKLLMREHRRRKTGEGALFGEAKGDEVLPLGGGYTCIVGGARYDQHLADLLALGRAADQQGIPVVSVVWECHLQATEVPHAQSYFHKAVMPVVNSMRQAGFRVLPLFDRYQALMQANGWPDMRPLWMTPEDLHPTIQGHAVMAGWLMDFVKHDPGLMTSLTAVVRSRPEAVYDERTMAAIARYRQSLLWMERGEFDAAARGFRDVLAVHPDNIGVRLSYGRCLQEMAQWEQAAAEYEQVLVLRPDSALARLSLGTIRMQQGRLQEALDDMTRAAAAATDSWTQQAVVHWMGEVEKATAAVRAGETGNL